MKRTSTNACERTDFSDVILSGTVSCRSIFISFYLAGFYSMESFLWSHFWLSSSSTLKALPLECLCPRSLEPFKFEIKWKACLSPGAHGNTMPPALLNESNRMLSDLSFACRVYNSEAALVELNERVVWVAESPEEMSAWLRQGWPRPRPVICRRRFTRSA